MKRSKVLSRVAMLRTAAVCAALAVFGCSGSSDDGGGGGFELGGTSNGGSSGSANGSSGAGTSNGGTGGSGNASGAGGDGVGGTAGDGGTLNAGGSGGDGGAGGTAPLTQWDRKPTAGCGKEVPADQAFGGYTEYTIQITGETLGVPNAVNRERQIFVWLPTSYDKNKPYRVVFITVGCGAQTGLNGAYQLMDTEVGGTEEAIYVALSLPLPAINNNCYDNRGGINSIEWESLDLDHKFVAENFCVDDNRIFTAGYSTGGWTSNMFSCYFGGMDSTRKFGSDWALRGAMGVSGCWIDGNPECTGPVAQMWIHDTDDTDPNLYSCNRDQLARVLEKSGCAGGVDGPTEPIWATTADPSSFFLTDSLNEDGSCDRYTNCPPEYPVIWCGTQGRGHSAQPDNAVPGFTKFMDLMEPDQRPTQ